MHGTTVYSRLGVAIVTLWATGAHATDGITEAIGEATIRNGDNVTAKKTATADALKKAIEKIVGISIQSEFTSELQETVANSHSQFDAKVRDAIIQKADGFIQTYDITHERISKGIMYITVRAHVFESKVKAEVKRLADLIAAAGNPKLMLVIQEVIRSPDGTEKISATSTVAALLEENLISRGFEIRGQGIAGQATNRNAKKFTRWMDNIDRVSAMARDAGADILIFGRIEIIDKGAITEAQSGGIRLLVGQHRIEINSIVRGINAASAEVLSNKPTQMSSIGINIEKALHRAMKGHGKNLIRQTFDGLLDDLKTSFQKTAQHGQSYTVRLVGVKSFRKQGRRFLSMLKELGQVSNVRQKSFDKGQLVISLACICDTTELQNKIFNAIEHMATLDSLDANGVSGKQLSFQL